MVEAIIKTIPSKGTRLAWAKSIGWFATIGWFASIVAIFAGWATIEQITAVGVTYGNWKATMVFLLGVYAASETGVKVGESLMNRG